MIKQPSVENCLEMLGFNPYDTEYDFGVIRKFDKIKAKFVLDNFNNNNREINLGQRVNLRKNIELNMTDKNDILDTDEFHCKFSSIQLSLIHIFNSSVSSI